MGYNTYLHNDQLFFVIYSAQTYSGNDENLYRLNVSTLEWDLLPNNGESPGRKIASAFSISYPNLFVFGGVNTETNWEYNNKMNHLFIYNFEE